jgi:hypothetical protein
LGLCLYTCNICIYKGKRRDEQHRLARLCSSCSSSSSTGCVLLPIVVSPPSPPPPLRLVSSSSSSSSSSSRILLISHPPHLASSSSRILLPLLLLISHPPPPRLAAAASARGSHTLTFACSSPSPTFGCIPVMRGSVSWSWAVVLVPVSCRHIGGQRKRGWIVAFALWWCWAVVTLMDRRGGGGLLPTSAFPCLRRRRVSHAGAGLCLSLWVWLLLLRHHAGLLLISRRAQEGFPGASIHNCGQR